MATARAALSPPTIALASKKLSKFEEVIKQGRPRQRIESNRRIILKSLSFGLGIWSSAA
jgi:hypothetical protein